LRRQAVSLRASPRKKLENGFTPIAKGRWEEIELFAAVAKRSFSYPKGFAALGFSLLQGLRL